MFSFESSQLHRCGNTCDEFNQLMIKQRHPCLQRNRHTHAINFCKYVPGQVCFAVDVEQGVKFGISTHVATEFPEIRTQMVPLSKLIAEVGSVQRTLGESGENRNVIEIPADWIERHIMQVVAPPGSMRQSPAQWIHQAFLNHSRNQIELGTASLGHVTRVAGKEFVTSVASQYDLDVLPG